VVEDWYLYRGTCNGGHMNILPVRMVGLPGHDNDAHLGTTRMNSCAKCGEPVLLRWDDEAAPTTGQGPGR